MVKRDNHLATWELPPMPTSLSREHQDMAAWWELHNKWRSDFNTCATCGSSKLTVKKYDSMWHDGELYCANGHYVRAYDAG